MSLGCRFMRRGKSAAIACLASTPREPLSFLYPSWNRSHSTSSPAPIPAQVDDPLQSISHTCPSYQVSVEPRSDISSARSNVELVAGKEQDVNNEDGEERTPSFEFELPTTAQNRKLENGGFKNRLSPQERPLERRISYVYTNFHRAKDKEEHERKTRRLYQDHMRESRQSWVPDWRVILEDLYKNTPHNERRLMAVEVVVAENAAGRLLRGVDDNIWEIADRYSCAVELFAQDPRTKTHRTFHISGPPSAISKTAADIFKIDPNAKIKATTTGVLSKGSEGNFSDFDAIRGDGVQRPRNGKARNVMSTKPYVVQVTKAENIPRPAKWTERTFAEYVAALTASEMPNHLYRFMYRQSEDHVSSIIKILREFFLDPDCRPVLSRKAFNTAIEYFVESSCMADARAFFVHMELMEISMDVKTFNILLRGAAKNEDLHNFQFILHLMLRRNILPNSSTWIAFLMLNPDLRIKLYAFDKMKERGLVWNMDTMKDVCKYLVTHEISASLDNAQSQTEFINHMDSRYGYAWLTKISGSQIIDVLGLRGLISRCWNFLFVMIDRSITPHEACINTILNRCKQVGNIRGAIELLLNLPPSISFIPDEVTYHILFAMAWRGRRYNLARVVWRYACLNASTTRSMRVRVVTSLMNSKFISESMQSYRFFENSAGSIISPSENFQNHPVVVYREGFKDAFGCEPVENSHKMEDFSTGDDSERSQTPPNSLGGFPKHISHDCEVFQWWKPVRPFVDMLAEACTLDEEWMNLPRREDRQNAERISWLMKNAISVPIRAEIGGEEILTEWK